MTSPNHACRSCGSTGLQSLRCLVEAPAGAIPTCPTADFPLAFCSACSLVQRVPSAPAKSEPFFASSCPTRTRTAEPLARRMIKARRLGRGSLVIEAGSNDGWLLRHYREAGVPVLGIDPDREAAKLARHRQGIPTREVVFGKRAADLLFSQGLWADVFHGHNVLNRTAELTDFVRGVRRVLRDDGVAVLEVPHVRDVLDRPAACALEEDVFYFSLTALCHCLTGHGLLLEEVERTTEETLRLYATAARPGIWPGETVAALLREEETWGVRSFETYAPLARRVQALAA